MNAANTTTDIAGVIRQIFAEDLAIKVSEPEADLIEEGLLDSLAVADLLVQLESKFGFVVDMEALDLEDLRTLSGIAAYVARSTQIQ